MAVLCLDLDQFKQVNDTLGHPTGDLLLQAVADRLGRCVRETDVVARLGGDEFAIIQFAMEQPAHATLLAQRVIQEIGTPYEIAGHRLIIGASVGIAIAPDDGNDPDHLLRSADMALYRAKSEGRSTYSFFEPEMNAHIQARRAMELDLRNALPGAQFELVYQPLVSLETNAISGFEALLRWNHPERGVIPPAEFIPIAEEIGLIGSIGAWVLKHACADAASWPSDIRLGINVSAPQLKRPAFLLDVVAALQGSGMPPSRLEIEVTETVLLQDTDDVVDTLQQLRNSGVRISLDDFGTGYSSLSYLLKFPFDKIKIDRSFVQGLGSKKGSDTIIRAVTQIARTLEISTIAEGIETDEQLAKVRTAGCTEGQGYLFSPPRPASELPGLIASFAHKGTAAA